MEVIVTPVATWLWSVYERNRECEESEGIWVRGRSGRDVETLIAQNVAPHVWIQWCDIIRATNY